jgi:hypothetical protein
MEARLSLVMDEDSLSPLYLILQQGFFIRAQVGCSLNMFLENQMELSPEYISEKIQTIFLNGRPVDDLNSALIEDGSHLALSAAMPGLVGAAMRRGGVYSSLRNSISYQETHDTCVLHEGSVHVKLFNLLMKDLGPIFLKRGITIPASDLSDFFSKRADTFWLGCRGIFLNKNPLSRDVLLKGDCLSNYEMICLSVKTDVN